MPPRQNSNSKIPGSSSSISLNGSQTEETNYDSDISEDDNAIAEGDDDEDGEEQDEGFELEVSTLTGNTFSVMIHPSDTVEVLKTRIAFQEGISPADQNLLLEQGKLLDTTNTLQELNIDRNSRLTLVTNVATGVPFKTFRDSDDSLSLSSSSNLSKFAPTLKRNYNIQNHNVTNSHPGMQPSSIRLPKILTANNSMFASTANGYHQNMPMGHHRNGMHNSVGNPTLKRLDEREWMQSLFNKVVQQDDMGDNDINIDSTNISGAVGSIGSTIPRMSNGHTTTIKTATEEDGSILVVQGDDGVILIIQKNTGQLLDDTFDSNYGYDNNNNNQDIDYCNGRMGRMGRYESSNASNSTSMKSYHSQRYYRDTKVHEKIKENAVTLEKMRQVRSMMAQKHRTGQDSETIPSETFGFPKISDSSASTTAGIPNLRKDSVPDNRAYGRKDNRSATSRNVAGTTGVRSINSSKMSLNRLIAEIYLQSKRKGHAIQPGQPPYTQLQLMKYVQFKVAILMDEQRQNNAEPCTKCQQDEDWIFDENAPYLTPTVVMNRYKRLTNARNSKSLDKEFPFSATTTLKRSTVPITGNARSTLCPPVNGSRTAATFNGGSQNKNASSVCPPIQMSRKSSSTARRFSSTNNTLNKLDNLEECNSNGLCDISIRNSNINHSAGGNQNRPSFKIYPRMQSQFNANSNGHASKKSSRPGSSSKGGAGTGKKGVRCHACRKKLGLACRYQCRCGMMFCSIHRYAETHECTYDYKTEGRNKLRENNPVVVAAKIQEI